MNNKDFTYKVNKENLCTAFSFGEVKKSDVNFWINKSHFHSSFEVQYILSGSAYITTPGKTSIINANTFCVIPPNTEHYISTNKDITAEKFAIRIDFGNTKKPHDFDFYKYVTGIFGKLSQPMSLSCAEAQYYTEKLIELLSSENKTSSIQITALLTLILVSICENIKQSILYHDMTESTGFTGKNDVYSAKIEGYIVRNYDKKISLKMLSDELSLSSRQCERIIKEYFNMDFRMLLLKQRMVIARQLINERAYSLEAISEKCGYSSYAGFYKAFKQYYNMSPNKILFTNSTAEN